MFARTPRFPSAAVHLGDVFAAKLEVGVLERTAVVRAGRRVAVAGLDGLPVAAGEACDDAVEHVAAIAAYPLGMEEERRQPTSITLTVDEAEALWRDSQDHEDHLSVRTASSGR